MQQNLISGKFTVTLKNKTVLTCVPLLLLLLLLPHFLMIEWPRFYTDSVEIFIEVYGFKTKLRCITVQFLYNSNKIILIVLDLFVDSGHFFVQMRAYISDASILLILSNLNLNLFVCCFKGCHSFQGDKRDATHRKDKLVNSISVLYHLLCHFLEPSNHSVIYKKSALLHMTAFFDPILLIACQI